MDLNEIIEASEIQEPIWIAYPGSKTFQVLTRPLGNKQPEFLEKSREVKWDEGTMEQKVTFNNDIYNRLFGEHVIVDWKGLHIEDLKKLVLLKNFKKLRQFTGEIACDETAKLLLLKHSVVFNAWINRVCANIELLNREREEAEEKNS